MLEQLSVLDRFLPVWIGAAMLLGLVLGRLFPGLNDSLDRVRIGTVSLPIAIGLLLMMYPVLAKVRYDDLGHVTGDRRLLGTSLFLNWVVGPLLMFTLAWVFLPDLPEYRTGLIIVGLARCIAMVLIWNDLACGDPEAAAVLVALNSLFQIAAYSLLGYFYLELLPGWLGLEQAAIHFSVGAVARAVAVSWVCRSSPDTSPAGGAKPAEAASGTRASFSPASVPLRCGGCCSRSSSCSRCRATRSPTTRSTWSASPSRCSSTSG